MVKERVPDSRGERGELSNASICDPKLLSKIRIEFILIRYCML